MFPEHWEHGMGTWNMERNFVKTWCEGGIPILYVPIKNGTRSKCDGNDVLGTLFRNEERVPNYYTLKFYMTVIYLLRHVCL
jgi:hypothetical protein